MNLLAFETATEACSVAIWVDGQVRERFEVAPRRHAELALPWAEQLLAEAGITRRQLDAIAVGRGPGAFTGVRLGIALAQGIALALDRPVVPISTLAALAAGLPRLRRQAGDGEGLRGRQHTASETTSPPPNLLLPSQGGERELAQDEEKIIAAIDARMGEVYLGAFRRSDDDVVAMDREVVVKPDAAVVPDGDKWHGVGTGFDAADGALRTRLHSRLRTVDGAALPRASDVARLAALAFARGEAVAPEAAEPAYLRDNVALTLAEQRELKQRR